MFAGALVGTVTPAADTGFRSAHVVFDTPAYAGMNYATFHKFTYVDAYT